MNLAYQKLLGKFTKVCLSAYLNSFRIKDRYHFGAGVNTDKREDRQKEKENIVAI